MKRWYNIEMSETDWSVFRSALIEDGEETGEPWKWEASGLGYCEAYGENGVHIEIEAEPSELHHLNEILLEFW